MTHEEIGELLVSLLEEAHDKRMDSNLSAEAYKGLAEIVMGKADELIEKGKIDPSDWDAVQDEFAANQMLVDDVI